MKKPPKKREIPVLFLKGNEQLGEATGVTADKTHARWREKGLKYSVMEDGTFLYYIEDVIEFIKNYYAPQQVNGNL